MSKFKDAVKKMKNIKSLCIQLQNENDPKNKDKINNLKNDFKYKRNVLNEADMFSFWIFEEDDEIYDGHYQCYSKEPLVYIYTDDKEVNNYYLKYDNFHDYDADLCNRARKDDNVTYIYKIKEEYIKDWESYQEVMPCGRRCGGLDPCCFKWLE